MNLRDATPEEAATIWPEPGRFETWVGVAEENEEIVGHICLSRQDGNVFGHDVESRSDDETVALRLWRMARKKAKDEWGVDKVHIHTTPDTSDKILEFWRGRGAIPIFTVMELAL